LHRFEKFKGDLGILKVNINKVTQEELDRYQDYTSAENPAEESPYTVEQEFVNLWKILINLLCLVLG